MHNKLERDVYEITTDSDIMSGQEGKTPSKLDAITADYHCKVKESRMQTLHCRRLMQGNALQQVYDACIYVCSFTEEEAIALRKLATKQLTTTPATAAQRPVKVSLLNKLPFMDPRFRIMKLQGVKFRVRVET